MNERLPQRDFIIFRETFRALFACILAFGLMTADITPAWGQSHADAVKQGYKYGYDPNAARETSGVTDIEVQEGFSCAGGSPQGDLFINQQCSAGGAMGIFANIVCRVENLFGWILALLFCGMQSAVLDPLIALLVLYVTIYGAMVTLGMVDQTFREAIKHTAKIGLVLAFATNAELAIQVGYKFYISFLQTSVGIVFGTYNCALGGSNDEMKKNGYMPVNDCQTDEHWMSSLDGVMDGFFNMYISSGVGIIIAMLLLMIFAPTVFMIVLAAILQVVKAFVQAIIGYLVALLMITFLFSLAPIFVSFALFRFTARWFEAWLAQLATFTLQMLVIFSFMIMILMIDFLSFFQQVGTMIRSYTHVLPFGWIQRPDVIISLCQVRRTGAAANTGGNNPDGDVLYFPLTTNATGDRVPDISTGGNPNDMYSGFPACIEPYDYDKIIAGTATRFPPGLDATQLAELKTAITEAATYAKEPLAHNPMDTFAKVGQIHELQDNIRDIVDKANEDLIIPFLDLVASPDLILFIIVRLLAIFLLARLMSMFLQDVPALASALAGSFRQTALGGGSRPGDMEGLTDTIAADLANRESDFSQELRRNRNPFRAPQRISRALGAKMKDGHQSVPQAMLMKRLDAVSHLGMSEHNAQHDLLMANMMRNMQMKNMMAGEMDPQALADMRSMMTADPIHRQGRSRSSNPRRSRPNQVRRG